MTPELSQALESAAVFGAAIRRCLWAQFFWDSGMPWREVGCPHISVCAHGAPSQ